MHGNDSLKFELTVPETLVFAEDMATGNAVENRFDEVSGHITAYLSRADWEGTWPAAPTQEERNVEQSLIDSMSVEAYIGAGGAVDEGKPWQAERKPRQQRTPLTFAETEIKLYDLIGADYDDPRWETLLSQLTVKEMRYLVGTGNFNTAAIDSIGKPKTTDPDGPRGIHHLYVRCRRDRGGVRHLLLCLRVCDRRHLECGACPGHGEFHRQRVPDRQRAGDGRTYSGWYGPAMNIHRTPFSGRNREYYSEDGLLSGRMAASVVTGAREKGVNTMVKHFAVNDQETDRDTNGLITWLNEQALREIYLRPFELAVKEGKSLGIMSSFNRIGTVWAGGSYELLTEILRNEWGFQGMVITDYANAYMNPDQMIRAGGDLCLFQDQQPSASGPVVNASHLTALRQAAKNILYATSRTNAMNGMGEGIEYGYAPPYWEMALFGFDAAVAAGCILWGSCRFGKP